MKHLDKYSKFNILLDNLNNSQLKTKKSYNLKKSDKKSASDIIIYKKVSKGIEGLFNDDKKNKEKEKDKINNNKFFAIKEAIFMRVENKLFRFNKSMEQKSENLKICTLRKGMKSKTIKEAKKDEISNQDLLQLRLSIRKSCIVDNENKPFFNKIKNISQSKTDKNLICDFFQKNTILNKNKKESDKNKESLLIHNLLNFGKILKNQEYLGEEALKYHTFHEYSAYCLTDTHMFSLKKEYYYHFLYEKVIQSEKRMTNFIKKIFPLLKQKPKYVSLIGQLRPNLVNKGTYLYTIFDNADYIYLIYQGECALVEPLENMDDKKEFLIEKSKYKIISILKEGAIAGFENFSYNTETRQRIKTKYENCLLVTGKNAIVFKLPIDDFFGKDHLLLNSIKSMKKQRERFSVINPNIFNLRRSTSFAIKNTICFKNASNGKLPEIFIENENATKRKRRGSIINLNLNNINIISKNNKNDIKSHYQIKKSDSIFKDKNDKKDISINQKEDKAITTKKNDKKEQSPNIYSYTNSQKYSNKKPILMNNLKEILSSEKKKQLFISPSTINSNENRYLNNKKDQFTILSSINKSKIEFSKMKIIKKRLINRKLINDKDIFKDSYKDELRFNVNTYHKGLFSERSDQIYNSDRKQQLSTSNAFKFLVEEKKFFKNKFLLLNKSKGNENGSDTSKGKASSLNMLKNSIKRLDYSDIKSKSLINNERRTKFPKKKFFNKNKVRKVNKIIKINKYASILDQIELYNSGAFTLPLVYKLLSNKRKKKNTKNK